MNEEEREYFLELQKAREALFHDASWAMQRGASKEEWKSSDFVRHIKNKIWWLEYSDIYYIAEYVWEYQSEFVIGV